MADLLLEAHDLSYALANSDVECDGQYQTAEER